MESGRDPRLDVTIDRGREGDALGIATVHAEVWRNAYPGMLPDRVLAGMSVRRLAMQYAHGLRSGRGVRVARAGDGLLGATRGIVGFTTFSPVGVPGGRASEGLADAEVETLYVLDDWRDRGIGRSLLAGAAAALAGAGCRSMFLWVLADNPSRWFYERLGGRASMRGTTRVGGEDVKQIAMIWDRIDSLAGAGGV